MEELIILYMLLFSLENIISKSFLFVSMLKIDLHIHAKEDKHDIISYSAKELVDKAIENEFDAISFTFHSAFYYPKKLVDYATKNGLLLIPGSELCIEGRDVLVYNFNIKEFNLLQSSKNFKEFYSNVKKVKKKNKFLFIVAPHPYFKLSYCVNEKLEKYGRNLFDAVEFSWFYSKLINFNKKGMQVARKFNLPMIANSDCHLFNRFGLNYTLVDSSKCDISSIFTSIKKGKVRLVSKAVNELVLFIEGLRMFLPNFCRKVFQNLNITKTNKKV